MGMLTKKYAEGSVLCRFFVLFFVLLAVQIWLPIITTPFPQVYAKAAATAAAQ